MSRFVFGERSQHALKTCHPLLRAIMMRAIGVIPRDFSILEGYRDKRRQNELFEAGRSKVQWPNSKHNNLSTMEDVARGYASAERQELSMAVDVAPYPLDWNKPDEFIWLAGFLMGVGEDILAGTGYTLRWGGDWDRDGEQDDQRFMDYPHLELHKI